MLKASMLSERLKSFLRTMFSGGERRLPTNLYLSWRLHGCATTTSTLLEMTSDPHGSNAADAGDSQAARQKAVTNQALSKLGTRLGDPSRSASPVVW